MKLFPMILAALLAVIANPLVAQGEFPELEAKVASAKNTVDADLASLRRVYHLLEKRFRNLDSKEREKVELELARTLEAVVRQCAEKATGNAKRARRNIQGVLDKHLEAAIEQVKAPELQPLRPWLLKRFTTLIEEAKHPRELLDLGHVQVARLVLLPLIDQNLSFAKRWNELLFSHIAEVAAYRKALAALKGAEQELAIAKDPLLVHQLHSPPGFARIPAGSYVLACRGGTLTTIRKSDRRIKLTRPVDIGLREVTIREYWEWVKTLPEDQRDTHLPRHDRRYLWPLDEASGKPIPTPEILDHPVTGIRLTSALLYAKAQGARLPSEEEWCAAAGGPENLDYPWGKKYEEECCNDKQAAKDALVAVGSFEKGRGPFGHWDLAGNASEWTITSESGKLIDPEDMKDDNANAVVRGGSFESSNLNVRVGWVGLQPALYARDRTIGFRLARDVKR